MTIKKRSDCKSKYFLHRSRFGTEILCSTEK